jgi:hypothetical protein
MCQYSSDLRVLGVSVVNLTFSVLSWTMWRQPALTYFPSYLLEDRAQELLSAPSHRRDNPELLQHAQGIKVVPRLYDLAPGIVADGDPRHRDPLASWGDAHQLTFVCSGSCPAGRYFVPFGDLILNRKVDVREGAAVA